MGFLSNPKLPYFVRIAQILFAIGVLILVSYAGVHRGWWKDINGALAVAVIATIFTFVVTIHAIWSYHRSNPFNGSGKVFIIMRLVLEILIFFLWIAAATLMLRHKGGCEDRVLSNGQDTCFDKHGKPEGGIKWTDHPVISWDVAVVFSFIEIVSFVLSAALVFVEHRSNKPPSGTGVSYA